MKLAQRAERLPIETAFAQSERLVREGIRFTNFAHGDPDQATPDPIKAAAVRALEQGETHYADTFGLPLLREAIAAHVTRTRGVPVSWEEVLVLPGANPAFFLSLLALADDGDEVVYPNPGYPLYASVIRAVGANPVPLPLRPELGYAFDPQELRAALSPRTRAIIVNSPHNPTGAVLGPQHVAALAEVVTGTDIWVLSDEVYHGFVYEGACQSLLTFPECRGQVLLIDSFSKVFAMTGWRLGYVVGPQPLIGRLGTLFAQLDFSVNTFIQHAGVEALKHYDPVVAQMRAVYLERRDRMVAGLNAVPGVTCPVPAGSFYAFADVTAACRRLAMGGALEFQHLALQQCRVALLARDWFGPRNRGERGEFVRLAYTVPLVAIGEGMQRLHELAAR